MKKTLAVLAITAALTTMTSCVNNRLTRPAAIVLQDLADLGCEVSGGALTIFVSQSAGGALGTLCMDLADKAIEGDTAPAGAALAVTVPGQLRVRVVALPLVSCTAVEMVALPSRNGAHGETACPSLLGKLQPQLKAP